MATHSQIEICAVPINTALICLVWSDQAIRDKFQKKQIIISLYKRLIYKNKTEANNHLKNKMSFLEQIAYESFVATGK
ncbi:hypothetical protein [Rickettsia sp. Tenjiku01]|uniref:hypothetical protein n=1 Tax=Rickettsia sp. Tenjiku01 TaxID=1736693 RepID=UPI0007DAFA24|nr:hypothetical protein [Rickettsia sp. Tenjiku01]